MGFSINETTTLGEVSACLVGCNASLRYGDKLSILYLMQVRPQKEVTFYMPHAELKLYEFVLEGDSRIPFYTLVDERLFRSVDGYVCTDEQVGEGAVGYVHSRKTKRAVLYSTQSLVLLPGTVLCRTYGSPEKSYEAAASYGAKVENGKREKIESGKLKVESEGLKKDKVTAAKVVSMARPNETRDTGETAGRGIAREPVKAKQARKLKAKKKVNKNGNKRKKRIRGKP
jgi:hypothetical protein